MNVATNPLWLFAQSRPKVLKGLRTNLPHVGKRDLHGDCGGFFVMPRTIVRQNSQDTGPARIADQEKL